MPEPDASGKRDLPQCESNASHTWKSSPLFENDTEFAALKKSSDLICSLISDSVAVHRWIWLMRLPVSKLHNPLLI